MNEKINKYIRVEEIPEQIKDNISLSEEIVHQTKWIYTPKIVKISNYIFVGMAIFLLISIIYAFLRTGGNIDIFKDFWSIYFIMIPIVFVFMFIFFRRFSLKRKYFLLITNKKLYLYTKAGREDLIDSIELTSIKAVIFRKKRISRKSKESGKIMLISDDLKENQKNRIVIQNVQNLSYSYQRLESILWHYGNVKERIELLKNKNDISLPCTFKIEQKTFQRYTRYCRIFDILIMISIVAIGIGIWCIFLKIEFFIILVLLMFGCAFAVFFSVSRYIMSNILTPISSQLVLTENKINLHREEFSETILFDDKITLDFLRTQDLKKSSIGTYEVVGTIIIKESLDSSKIIKFGPVFEFDKFLEVIYLHILNWKGKQGLLLAKEKFKEVSQVLEKEIEKPKSEEIYVENDVLKQVQSYLERNEQIQFKYKPVVNLKKQIIMIIIGISSFILLYVGIDLTFYFLSINFFVITIFILIFPMMFGILALCTLPGILMEKKSLYIFTDQKLIIKYPKQFIITKFSNISSINRINKRNRYHLVINLKKELESSPFIDKSKISIQNIPKDNNLIDKVKYIREKIEE